MTENAQETFFYWKGDWFTNVCNTCVATVIKNNQKAGENWTKIKIAWGSSHKIIRFFKIFFYLAMMLSIHLGCLIFLPAIIVVFVAIFIVCWLIYNTVALFFVTLEWIYLKAHGVYSICPSCNNRVDLPVFLCPDCKGEQKRLVPSMQYGIFTRKCRCGKRLPTAFFNGRNKLPAKCPRCGKAGDSRGNLTQSYHPHTIVFLGGPDVGKTMLRDTIALCTPPIARHNKWVCTSCDKDETDLKTIQERHNLGIRPEKTQPNALGNIASLRMDIHTGASFPTRLCLYDPSGESFRNQETMNVYNYYEHMKSIVIVIDPFFSPVLRRYYPNQSQLGFSVSADDPADCLERWLTSVVNHLGGSLERLKDIPCAVVINKCDAPGFKRITRIAPGADSTACRQFLQQCRFDIFLNLLDHHFENRRYFAVSCTGGVDNGRSFHPRGIRALIEWLLYQLEE